MALVACALGVLQCLHAHRLYLWISIGPVGREPGLARGKVWCAYNGSCSCVIWCGVSCVCVCTEVRTVEVLTIADVDKDYSLVRAKLSLLQKESSFTTQLSSKRIS